MRDNKISYVLITAVKNEESFLDRTFASVLSQTNMPKRWVIVSDGSTDGTDEILKVYAAKHSFIEYFRLEKGSGDQGFGSKVFALQEAYERLKGYDYNFIGVLDGDVSFDSIYYQSVFTAFRNSQKLGISGGYIYELDLGGIYKSRKANRERCVAGAIQMFRRECYEKISGLHPIRYGGEDTLAEIMARFFGWEVRAFPELPVFHHKPGYMKRGIWKERLRMGKLDYVLGYHPVYELLKLLRRIPESPIVFGSVVRIFGYIMAMLKRERRIPSLEVVRFLRREQIRTLFRFKNKNNGTCFE